MPPRQLDQLVQDPPLPRAVRAPVQRFLLRHSLPLRHRLLHRNGRNPHPPPILEPRRYAEVFQ